MAGVAEAGPAGDLGDRPIGACQQPLDLAQTLGEDILADGTSRLVYEKMVEMLARDAEGGEAGDGGWTLLMFR